MDGATTYRFGDWFEWRPGTAHIFALGPRIATRSTYQASLRPASIGVVWPADLGIPLQAGALAALYLGLLAVVAGSGGLPQMRRRDP